MKADGLMQSQLAYNQRELKLESVKKCYIFLFYVKPYVAFVDLKVNFIF